jgi:hypothetical protein
LSSFTRFAIWSNFFRSRDSTRPIRSASAIVDHDNAGGAERVTPPPSAFDPLRTADDVFDAPAGVRPQQKEPEEKPNALERPASELKEQRRAAQVAHHQATTARTPVEASRPTRRIVSTGTALRGRGRGTKAARTIATRAAPGKAGCRRGRMS